MENKHPSLPLNDTVSRIYEREKIIMVKYVFSEAYKR